MTTWNDDTVTTLATLWMRGVPARAIGDTLGISTSAVIAKANRLRLQRRAVGGKRLWRRARRERARVETAASGIPFLETEAHHCRYVVHESADGFFCCGLPRVYDTAWCAFHCTVCFTPEGLESMQQRAAQRAAASPIS
jgi:hypothetical protein